MYKVKWCKKCGKEYEWDREMCDDCMINLIELRKFKKVEK